MFLLEAVPAAQSGDAVSTVATSSLGRNDSCHVELGLERERAVGPEAVVR